MFPFPSIDVVIRESVETILWQAGEMTDEYGNTLPTMWEDAHNVETAHYTTQASIVSDFFGFLSRISEDDVTAYTTALAGRSRYMLIHDYWITRNGHGTGFWDRGLGDLGERLTSAAQREGSYSVWEAVGPDDHADGYTGWFYE